MVNLSRRVRGSQRAAVSSRAARKLTPRRESLSAYSGPRVDRLRSFVGRLSAVSVLGLELPLLALWFVLATILALVAGRVDDWNDMTDELVWERLAVSVSQAHSILPTLHGQVIRSLSQLYPLLVSPFFWHGDIPSDIRDAHIFNAWLMTSAAIPAFLLARRVTAARWPAYTLAFVATCIPWLIYSTAILTEVAAYPAFIWGAYGMHRALTAPSKRNDALALLTLVVAFLARTQFSLLLAVFPCALVLYAVTAPRGRERGWARRALRAVLGDHVLAACGYAVLALGVGGYLASGRQLDQLSVYGNESHPKLLAAATVGAMTGHAADLAFALGILPFLAGSAWLLANVAHPPDSPALRAFACLGATTLVVLLAIVSAWDLTLGTFVFDRYLFYLTPLLVLGFLCALRDVRRPLWSLLLPTGVVCYGFAAHLQQSFLWSSEFPLSFDSPIAVPYRLIESIVGGRNGLSAFLIIATIGLAALFVAATRLVPGTVVTAAFVTLLVIAAPADTAFTFDKLLSRPGHSGRPLTRSESGVARLARSRDRERGSSDSRALSGQLHVQVLTGGLARPRVLEQVGALRRALPDSRCLRRRRRLVPEHVALFQPADRGGERVAGRRMSSRVSTRAAFGSPAMSRSCTAT